MSSEYSASRLYLDWRLFASLSSVEYELQKPALVPA